MATYEVHFFKPYPSRKWYTTEKVEWIGSNRSYQTIDEFVDSLRHHFKKWPDRLSEMDAVCTETCPPHILRKGEWTKEDPRWKELE